jgi:hypothetical protein
MSRGRRDVSPLQFGRGWRAPCRRARRVTQVDAQVWFTARAYRCPVCRLRLDSIAEIDKAFAPVWQIEDADWRDYEPGYYNAADDDAAAYECRREDRHGL